MPRNQPPTIIQALSYARAASAALGAPEPPELSEWFLATEQMFSRMPQQIALETLHSAWQYLALLDYLCRFTSPEPKMKAALLNQLSAALQVGDKYWSTTSIQSPKGTT